MGNNNETRELFVVDVNVTARQRRYLSQKGIIKPLEKGIYIRSELDEVAMMKKYAIRIFSHVYKNSYFSDVTAKSGKVFNDTIFMKGSHITTKESFGIKVAHYKNQLKYPQTKDILIKDNIGEFAVRVSDDVQLILEGLNFYKNYKYSLLSDEELKDLFSSLSNKYGGYNEALREIYNFADKNELNDIYDQLVTKMNILSLNKGERDHDIIHDFNLMWYNKKFGNLNYDGTGWNFNYASGWMLPLSDTDSRYKELPPFVEALMPEVAIGNKTDVRNVVESLKSGRRYLSNVSIVDNKPENYEGDPYEYIEDMIEGTVEKFSNEHSVFLGKHINIPERDRRFEIKFGRLMNNIDIPKISGAQIKMPAYLSYDGELSPVLHNEPFTHILKLPGASDYMHLGLLEWLSLKGLEFSGVNIASTALVNIEELNHRPAVISERFDIKKTIDDTTEIFCEDLSSIMGVISDNKYTKSAEEIGVAILKASTSPEEDAKVYIEQIVSSWLIGNGDFHLKNLVMIKEKELTEDGWSSVRLAPAFDVICTSVLHSMDHKSHFGIEGETFGINVNDKNFNLNANDFVSLGKMVGLKKQETMDIMERLSLKFYEYTYHIDNMLPRFVKEKESMIKNIEEMKQSIKYRVSTFGMSDEFYDNLNKKNSNIIENKPKQSFVL